MKKRTNMYFDEDDRALLALIKEHYNLSSDAAAVRLALKRIAEEILRCTNKRCQWTGHRDGVGDR